MTRFLRVVAKGADTARAGVRPSGRENMHKRREQEGLTAESLLARDQAALLPYRLRTVRIAVQSTVGALVALAIFALLPGHGHVAGWPFVALVVTAGVGCTVMSRVPWPRLFELGYGIRCLYAWSMMDIVLVTVAVAITGHAGSDLYVVYALTTIFFAASYPPKGQAALLAFTLGCYLTDLALSGWRVGGAVVFIRLASMALVAFMASFLSRELMQEMDAHIDARAESERRAALLAMVAGAARSMSTLDSERVLGIVVDAAVEIGFDGAEICMFDEDARTWSTAYRRGLTVGYPTTQPADTGLAGEVLRQRRTVLVEDYASWSSGVTEVREAGFHSTVAAPVWSGSELVGVLIAGSLAKRALHPYEQECMELLASQAGAALVSAHRYMERRAFEEQLHHQAFHDSLTGLPNRALFVDRLQHAISRLPRDGGSLAVLFLDIDRFTTINDSLGHDVGDKLLVEVAGRLTACLRPSDTLARYGGDEFTILLEDIQNTESDGAVAVAERILDVLRLPFTLAGRDVFAGTSIGIAFAPGLPGDEADPLREADLAMYRAKERGRGRWEVFEPEMNLYARGRLESETELVQAVDRGEFVLHYQPVVTLETGRVTGVEALVRWMHPRRGLVGPNEFIGLAEETGVIVRLGSWVLEEACRQAVEWDADGVPALQMNVNISAVQFASGDLVEQVAEVLATTGLAAERLTLEITESVVMEDVEAAVVSMTRLRQLGIQLSLDDFGQGYSSLSSLKRFPLDTVKIDRSFVDGLVASAEDQAIVRSVVMLAREMHMTVTAEGIESNEQLEAVRRLGCNEAQGYLFSAPLPGVGINAAASPAVAALVAGAD
jgi:diguanylate cyclase (GGDEF)-like protein